MRNLENAVWDPVNRTFVDEEIRAFIEEKGFSLEIRYVYSERNMGKNVVIFQNITPESMIKPGDRLVLEVCLCSRYEEPIPLNLEAPTFEGLKQLFNQTVTENGVRLGDAFNLVAVPTEPPALAGGGYQYPDGYTVGKMTATPVVREWNEDGTPKSYEKQTVNVTVYTHPSRMADYTGQDYKTVYKLLSDLGYIPAIMAVESDLPAGQVVRTDPAPGASLGIDPKSVNITLYYSKGPGGNE